MSLISRAGTLKRLRRSKAAREKFVDSQISRNVATQIRAIRDRQGLSQEQLAELAGGMNQNAISRLESPEYGKPTLTTLKRIAAAFDVGLVVRFVPFSQMVDWASSTPFIDKGHSTEAFAVPSFTEEERVLSVIPPMVVPVSQPQGGMCAHTKLVFYGYTQSIAPQPDPNVLVKLFANDHDIAETVGPMRISVLPTDASPIAIYQTWSHR